VRSESFGSVGDGGISLIRGLLWVKNELNVSEAFTRSLRNGFVAPQNRARIVFKIEQ
jgi:hypothetical protein